MAIISRRSMIRCWDFVRALEHAVRGVMLVRAGEAGAMQAVCTSWLITDSLVVVPSFAISKATQFICSYSPLTTEAASGDEELKAVAVFVPPKASGTSLEAHQTPALLRLERPQPGRSLKLQPERPLLNDALFLVQFIHKDEHALLSTGNLRSEAEGWLRYDADTQPGASGAPILDITGCVLGMHVQGSAEFNEGVSLSQLLKGLHAAADWPEIAAFHNLADVRAADRAIEAEKPASESMPVHQADLDRAVVRWSFDPAGLSGPSRQFLAPLVVDPDSKRWILRPEERQRLLKTQPLGHWEQAAATPGVDPGDQVIQRILRERPVSLAKITEDELPRWLQAVRWFEGTVPGLPTADEVGRDLERRRFRSGLVRLAGPDFRGRNSELRRLRRWFADGRRLPMVVTGIGGAGKSALIASFVQELGETPVFWLDFDRADLAPDQPASVLRLLRQQAELRFPDFPASPPNESDWTADARRFGREIVGAAGDQPCLIILDGFEMAQHVREHREIWKLLEVLREEVSRLRVLVAGRAPVAGLRLNGQEAEEPLILGGIERADAAEWLKEHGVGNEAVLESLLNVSGCLPLKLKFAVRLLDQGEPIENLRGTVPQKLVDGFLYERILDRVINPELRELARDALVLRRITEDMLTEVLPENLPEDKSSTETFMALTQELALVDAGVEDPWLKSTSVLVLRPELRSASLRLLEMADARRVRTIDLRAERWYTKQAKQDPSDVDVAAELVYHRLRLARVKAAEEAWRDGCARRLLFAEQDLPADALRSRKWLRRKLEAEQSRAINVSEREAEAVLAIRSALAHGRTSAIPVLLDSLERTESGPLVLYEAWDTWQRGDLAAARALLEKAMPKPRGPIARDNNVLAALLAFRAGERRVTDRLLESIQSSDAWSDLPDPQLSSLLVRAARIRLTADLAGELELAQAVLASSSPLRFDVLREFLSPLSVVIPSLVSFLDQEVQALESLGFPAFADLEIPADEAFWKQFRRDLEEFLEENGFSERPPHWVRLLSQPTEAQVLTPLVMALANNARRRWAFVGHDRFLAEACRIAEKAASDWLALSVVSTLALFCGESDKHRMHYKSADVRDLFDRAFASTKAIPPPGRDRASLVQGILRFEAELNATSSRETLRQDTGAIRLTKSSDRALALANRLVRFTGDRSAAPMSSGEWLPVVEIHHLDRKDLRRLCLYLLAPDPLELLVRRALGLPQAFPL